MVLFELDSFKCLSFEGVTHKSSICIRQCVATSQYNSRVSVIRVNVLTCNHSLPVSGCLANTYHSIHHEVSLSQRSGLVEAANVNLSCEGDSEWLRTKNLLLNQLDNAVVHGHRELHWEFWGDHVRENNNAPQYYLVAGTVYILKTLS